MAIAAHKLRVGQRLEGRCGRERFAGRISEVHPVTVVVVIDDTEAEFEICPIWCDPLVVDGVPTPKYKYQTHPVTVPARPRPLARTQPQESSMQLKPRKCIDCPAEFTPRGPRQINCDACAKKRAYQAKKKWADSNKLTVDKPEPPPQLCTEPGCGEPRHGRRLLCQTHWLARVKAQKKSWWKAHYSKAAREAAGKVALKPGDAAAADRQALAAKILAAVPSAQPPEPPAAPPPVPPPAQAELLVCDRCGGYYRHGIDGDAEAKLCHRCVADKMAAVPAVPAVPVVPEVPAVTAVHPLQQVLNILDLARTRTQLRVMHLQAAYDTIENLIKEGV